VALEKKLKKLYYRKVSFVEMEVKKVESLSSQQKIAMRSRTVCAKDLDKFYFTFWFDISLKTLNLQPLESYILLLEY
jgi:hypothetical protein